MRSWLESTQWAALGFQPVEQSPRVALAVQAWNCMAGIEWAAVPFVAELLGADDLEVLVRQLLVIRDFDEQRAKAARGE